MANFFMSVGKPGSGRQPRAFEIGYFQAKNIQLGRPVLGDPGLPSHFAINLPSRYQHSGLLHLLIADYQSLDNYFRCLIITSKRRPELQLSIKEGRPLSGQGDPTTLYQAEDTANGVAWGVRKWRLESFVSVKCPTPIPEECFEAISAADEGSRLDEASVRLLVHQLNILSESDLNIPFLDLDEAVRMLHSDDEATPAIRVPQRQVADEDYFHGDSELGTVSAGSSPRENTPGYSFSQADASGGDYVHLLVDIHPEDEPQKRKNSKQVSQDPSSSCSCVRELDKQ